MADKKKKILKTILLLSFFGVLVALYSLYEFYFGSDSSLCNINSTFSCTAVYKSGYSQIAGIPVALLGVMGYALIAMVAHWGINEKIKNYQNIILGLVGFSLVFSAYMASISAFVIKVWCPTCITSYIVVLSLFASSLILRKS